MFRSRRFIRLPPVPNRIPTVCQTLCHTSLSHEDGTLCSTNLFIFFSPPTAIPFNSPTKLLDTQPTIFIETTKSSQAPETLRPRFFSLSPLLAYQIHHISFWKSATCSNHPIIGREFRHPSEILISLNPNLRHN